MLDDEEAVRNIIWETAVVLKEGHQKQCFVCDFHQLDRSLKIY